jgi:hypothetical protein
MAQRKMAIGFFSPNGKSLLVGIALLLIVAIGCGGCPTEPQADESPRKEREDATPMKSQASNKEEKKAEETKAPQVPERRIPLRKIIAEAQTAAKSQIFSPPTKQELLQMESLVGRLLDCIAGNRPVPFEEFEREATTLGFELFLDSDGTDRFWILREITELKRGGGLFLFRTSIPKHPLVLQAPHSFSDKETGRIAEEIFKGASIFALLVNTMHRYAAKKAGISSRKGVCLSDFSHTEQSHLHFVSVALSKKLPRASFFQVHGFERSKHRQIDPEIMLIVSKGRASFLSDPFLDKLCWLLKGVLGPKGFAIYGKNIHILGGVNNVQGDYINSYSDDRFYHMELSRGFRRKLLSDRKLLTRFVDVFRRLARRA